MEGGGGGALLSGWWKGPGFDSVFAGGHKINEINNWEARSECVLMSVKKKSLAQDIDSILIGVHVQCINITYTC